MVSTSTSSVQKYQEYIITITKSFYSIVLLAICDSNYCFTLFNLGQYGSNNDCGVLANSATGEMMENDRLGIPAPSKLRSCNFDLLPYFFVGDEIFPLRTWLMRPLQGKLDDNKRIFNFRLSRARLTIENTFGVLAARWRIFYTPIRASVENVEKYTLACLALHDDLLLTDNAIYCPFGFVDSFDISGKLKQREKRDLNVDNRGLLPISRVKGSRYREDVTGMRNALIEYVNSEEGCVSWQKITYLRTTNLFTLSFFNTKLYKKKKKKNEAIKQFA